MLEILTFFLLIFANMNEGLCYLCNEFFGTFLGRSRSSFPTDRKKDFENATRVLVFIIWQRGRAGFFVVLSSIFPPWKCCEWLCQVSGRSVTSSQMTRRCWPQFLLGGGTPLLLLFFFSFSFLRKMSATEIEIRLSSQGPLIIFVMRGQFRTNSVAK